MPDARLQLLSARRADGAVAVAGASVTAKLDRRGINAPKGGQVAQRIGVYITVRNGLRFDRKLCIFSISVQDT